MKSLIGECLSPGLAKLERDQAFVSSVYVTWPELQSKADWMIVRCAVEESYVLVTNNASDFITPVGREDIHAGLVCLNAAPKIMNLQVQTELFDFALDLLDGHEPANDIVDTTLTDDEKFEIDQYTRHADS